jgi:uncharacterized membrane protein YheB (UPF0754 family)
VDKELLSALTFPLFSGALGYVTNWTGVLMLYYPVRFRGVKVPGLAALVAGMPRRVQQIPGLLNGGLGWQGIIPSRAAKMGSIAVDKGIAKLGNPSEFYEQLEPEKIAEHVVESSRGEMRELLEEAMRRENPQFWRDLPPQAREAIHRRVANQLPDVVHSITGEIGENLDQLLDVKLMVVRHLEENPDIANRVYHEVGERELNFIIRFGFVCGFVMGIPAAVITDLVLHFPWLYIPLSIAIGWFTNQIGIKMIFEPAEPRKIGPFTFQGLFVRRQHEASEAYASVIAEDVITLPNISQHLLHGPSADRTRGMIQRSLRGAVDDAAGAARPAVRVVAGPQEYEAVRESIAEQGVEHTMEPMQDEELDRAQREPMRKLLTKRMRELSHPEFAETLRSAMREDEWLLYLHGGVLGIFSGGLHLLIFPP